VVAELNARYSRPLEEEEHEAASKVELPSHYYQFEQVEQDYLNKHALSKQETVQKMKLLLGYSLLTGFEASEESILV